MRKLLAAGLLSVLWMSPARAQTATPTSSPTPPEVAPPAPTMYVDRPSVSNTAHTVGDGYVQLEQGMQFTGFGNHGAPGIFNAPLRLRVGTDDSTEFRLETSTFNFQGPNFGFGDLTPGFKHNFYSSDGLNLAVVGALEIPTSSAYFRAPGVVPTISLSSDWVLADDWGLLVNVFLSSPYNGNQRILEPTGTVFISHAFSGTVGGYFEFAAFGGPSGVGGVSTVGGAPVGAPGTTLVNGGFNFALSPTSYCDVEVFHGLTTGGFTWGGTVGYAQRW